ncbi:hypothetical protein [Streptomyces coffeae]|uniref:Uncharacterized protein n=1 Tax=Streptomyces coffeae TaxID=621382 RepID=A0ABS1NQ04_9ACTN|nr:hypothetical protein [Streptomyces coffeae]MBL1102153.1 hypothetical protein [Streptomyces coffeae]
MSWSTAQVAKSGPWAVRTAHAEKTVAKHFGDPAHPASPYAAYGAGMAR